MTTTAAHTPVELPAQIRRPGPAVTATGVLMALWCLGFAAVNLGYEVTGHFADGPLALYTSGLAVMNYLVVGLKVVGAAVALLAIASRRTYVSPVVVTALVWGAFATLAVYAFGGMVEAIGMVSGLVGGAGEIALVDVGYLLFFLAAAAGYGVLALSYSRRYGGSKAPAVLGALVAPALLAALLVGVWALLAGAGLVPAS